MRAVDERARAVGRFLLARRRELGLTQRAVAFRAGMSQNSVLRFEKGLWPVRSLSMTAALAKALEVNSYGLVVMVANGGEEIDRDVHLPSVMGRLAHSGVCRAHEPECLGELVFLLRVSARLGCASTARNAELHAATWEKLERGRYLPSIPVLERIAGSLGRDAEEYRVPLLVLAMRDQLRRQYYAARGQRWFPHWTRPGSLAERER
ncbi:helix-turn-helix domain-containing protein [Amycolatopsis rubida]|uniref:Helix-turn-helix domain-containing protein n=1 Tax=Amycolatopsis rubida TaxID=112413 RepID=A0A1I6A4G1_9PSEU|nr:helix-turn-helix transcriptional regulator [Amycolatopsis rubida]SFQ63555.1 Helix-turn-helix domain-containing protein [Amycolatopsis rubida]